MVSSMGIVEIHIHLSIGLASEVGNSYPLLKSCLECDVGHFSIGRWQPG